MKHRVAVIMGGFSSEYDISIASGDKVYQSISRSLFDPYRVIIKRDTWYVLDEHDERYEINKEESRA